ncbi:conserved Plasmodium protein, unknown function [Plasmodium knowlesi strain H]|uniref:Uncharacterized protein n=3 Tax=Plasmodium knowlesi TaxID=5850 RepID=A0A5K1U3T8_PLAKH|nr:heptatricopeptide repeat-containing protein, putative [Plasmodium knowlesi strain H]OTN65096.1 Uncharacterized protein PKNOH_S120158500 [Plasmodium knowlesi]CAA9988441.1 heptatricopeptide repeat-containing protein, putative [Plasmodium knowlesi strain H]SBO19854.1 conserved Plasmodium protein, unknown function [Plasmodium knowlesi strain H]SBO20432.1 conserved Plasmodium protein, unknown function [Plasmodium knowlesi strain H]VVS77915.1 heptatricopeptide repeat-containing protein, putative |eukprot:XP_002259422.1 hypothetical protein, conserved in Plasmodium species [Plasmodium knowlesi strain H]
MNEVKGISCCLKNLGIVQQSDFFLDRRIGTILRDFHSTPSRLHVLKNKEINRNKKQQIWMKKIHVKELPRKKFGNKLGTVAKMLYFRHILGDRAEDRVLYKKKSAGDCWQSTHSNAFLRGVNNPGCESSGIQISHNDKSYTSTCRSKGDSPWPNEEELQNEPNEKGIIQLRSNENEVSPTRSGTNVRRMGDPTEHHRNKHLWDDICDELKYHLPFLQPYSITTALNYLSKVNYEEYNIFKLVAENVDERWIKNFNIKDLSQLLLSYSRLHIKYDSFVNLISRELLYKICFANMEEIALIAYSYTKMKIYDYEVFLHLCNETKGRLKKELSQSVDNCADATGGGSRSTVAIDDNGKDGQLHRNCDNGGRLHGEEHPSSTLEDTQGRDISQMRIIHHEINITETNDGEGNPNWVHHNMGESSHQADYTYSKKGLYKESNFSDSLTELSTGKTTQRNGEGELSKKYSHICLFTYCLGKNKHRDDALLSLISKYINVERINNIDVSNLSYAFSLFNFYEGRFFEQFCEKSRQIVHTADPSQKVVILSYLLKHPTEEMLDVYLLYVKNIRDEMEQNHIYKEPLLLNMCINSFSNDVFLNFLLNLVTSPGRDGNGSEKINQANFVLNFLIDYATFFMRKKKMCSRDYPKILNMLLKIFPITSEMNDDTSSLRLVPSSRRVTLLIEDLLDLIIAEMHTFHDLDLAHIRNIFFRMKGGSVGAQFGRREEAILNFVNKHVDKGGRGCAPKIHVGE